MKRNVLIIDYGMGNLHSVRSAFNFLNCNTVISNKPKIIERAQNLVLPGVGSFRKAISRIREQRIDEAIFHALDKQSKFLGICLGFQLCGASSTEDGVTEGLGLLGFEVNIFRGSSAEREIKIPHVGFNEVQFESDLRLFEGINSGSDFYFNHSYRVETNSEKNKAICKYGEEFLAAFEHGNIFGTQFHPEKSQTNGLKLLSNFLKV
jgi:glutamine amidotransferase